MKKYLLIFLFLAASIVSCKKDASSDPGIDPEQWRKVGIMNIDTYGEAIVSRDDYIPATYDLNCKGEVLIKTAGGQIRGRGNSSWWNTPKKSFRVKFTEAQAMMKRYSNKDWCLLANAFDASMLHNDFTFWWGRQCRFSFTPYTDFVDVYLNGEYNGLYMIIDHLETAKHRVNKDVLLEIDGRVEEKDVSFNTAHLGPIVIRDPGSVTKDSKEYKKIVEYVSRADDALYSNDWKDPNKGYRKYFDMDALVDWYLVNEISKNNDACFFTSCFMNFSFDGKLEMGPLWDYDGAYGNTTYNNNFDPEGLWIGTHASWYIRLMEDPYFVDCVKKRLREFYNNRQDYYDYIDKRAEFLQPYVLADDEKWHFIANPDIWNKPWCFSTYQAYVDRLKSWLEIRYNWLINYFGA